MQSLHIGFLTDEFISEKPDGGGLGNYLNRITQSLKNLGHKPEVIVVVDRLPPKTYDYNGVLITRVPPVKSLPITLARSFQRRFIGAAPWGGPARYLSTSLALARTFASRHKQEPFHFVQSANTSAGGLFVRSRADCPHLIRLSSKRDLWFKIDKQNTRGAKLLAQLERLCVRKADIAYAPSQFVADQCKQGWRQDVKVVRPPIFLETAADDYIPPWLPEKYLIHFGQIGPRKGSDLVASALPIAWQQEPDLKMIWAGRPIQTGSFEWCHRLWGEQAHNVIWLGPIKKERLYTYLKQAVASVLPSRVDNVPNTVIESLLFQVPVIGSKGASIDELVDHGLNGELVEVEDVEALAQTMVKAWRKGQGWIGDFVEPQIFTEMDPERAALELIKLAGY